MTPNVQQPNSSSRNCPFPPAVIARSIADATRQSILGLHERDGGPGEHRYGLLHCIRDDSEGGAGWVNIALDCLAVLAMKLIIWLSTWHKKAPFGLSERGFSISVSVGA